jgi:hypothetical protein
MSKPIDDLSAEDAKLVTLARGARGRIAAAEGAAVRDEVGRTYSAATIRLPHLDISAIQLAIAQAVGAGARSLEAVVVVTTATMVAPADLAAIADLGGAPVFVADPSGTVKSDAR